MADESIEIFDRVRRAQRAVEGAGHAEPLQREPVFGQIKQGRGYRQFLLRGLRQVRGEWALICTTHNLLKLWRALRHRHPCPSTGLRALTRTRKRT